MLVKSRPPKITFLSFIKRNIQVVILLTILFVVSIPYVSKALQRIKDEIQYQQSNTEQQRKLENNANRKKILESYKISQIDYISGEINPEINEYIKANNELLTKWKGYDCKNNPPPTSTPYINRGKFFNIDLSEFTPSSITNDFTNLCKKIELARTVVIEFEQDLPKIKKFILDYQSTQDNDLKKFVKTVTDNLLTYENKLNTVFEKGYITLSARSISKGSTISFEYGYTDKTNNEHLESAVTIIIVTTPSGKKYEALNGKVFPSDFPGASTEEKGFYWVKAKRTIKTINNSTDILFEATSSFYVK